MSNFPSKSIGGSKFLVDAAAVACSGGVTTNKGNPSISAISYTGADIQTALSTEAADISDPGANSAWLDLITLSQGGRVFIFADDLGGVLKIRVDENENVGNALRLQMIRDDHIFIDLTAVGDGVSGAHGQVANLHQVGYTYAAQTNSAGAIIFGRYTGNKYAFTQSFKIRVARKGTFADSESYISLGAVSYDFGE